MIVRLFFLTLCLCCAALTLQAQERCGTVPYMQSLADKKVIKQNTKQFEDWIHQKLSQRKRLSNLRAQSGPYKIPVVVHVIHNGSAVGVGMNLSDAQILSQIQVLNDDFKRLNADAANTPAEFASLAGSLNIEFVMAKQTPEGLPTTGIVRVNGGSSVWLVSQDEELKAASYWPSEDYLNIWVTNLGNNYLGYAQFPVSDLEGLEEFQDELATTDGVVIDYTVFGVGSSDAQYNLGRTTTHEVGHFFGLRHIWGDTDGCSGTDYVNDTPNQEDETYNCPSHPQPVECGGVKMFQNYMDYTDDACLNLFTQGQVDRMTLILEDADVPRRGSLVNSHGLDDATCEANASVDAVITRVAQPGPVTCSTSPDLVLGIKNLECPIITSLKVEYSVNGGSTRSTTVTGLSIYSDGEERLVTVNNINLGSGENTITVKIAQVNGFNDTDNSNSETETTVIRDTESDIIPLRKTFDDDQIEPWVAVNPHDGIVWDLEQSRAIFPTQNGSTGEESWLVSPVLDFSNVTKASLFFDLSYTWNEVENDRLRILVSKDCGDSYTDLSPVFDLQGDDLNSDNEKKYRALSSFAGERKVRIAFVATGAQGNSIYIDNIEFFVSEDADPIDPGEKPFALYWDGEGNVNLTFNLSKRQDVELSVVDIMGHEVTRGTLEDVLNQTIPVSTGSISSGLYLIRLQVDQKYYTTKVYLAP